MSFQITQWNQALKAISEGNATKAITSNATLARQMTNHHVRDRVILYAIYPADVDIAGITNKRLLEGMKQAAQSLPNQDKAKTVVDTLTALAQNADNVEARGSTLGAAAYITWWCGDYDLARQLANEALNAHEQSSMAQLVKYAVTNEVKAPYVGIPANELLKPTPITRQTRAR